MSAGTDPAPAEAPDDRHSALESPALRLEGLGPSVPRGPLGAAGRHDLARDALTFFVRQQGNFPGGPSSTPRPHLVDGAGTGGRRGGPAGGAVVGHARPGQPAHLPPGRCRSSGWLDPAATSVTVDGVPLSGLERYIHQGVPAVSSGRAPGRVAVLDLVFAPRQAGATGWRCVPRLLRLPATAVYDLTVGEADGLGPEVLRAGDGALYAVLGSERLRVPDLQTATVFGFAPADVVPAAPETLASFSEGPPLPALRGGDGGAGPRQSAGVPPRGGRRVRDRELPASRAVEVHGPALNSVPPVLLDGMVVEGHAGRLPGGRRPPAQGAGLGLAADAGAQAGGGRPRPRAHPGHPAPKLPPVAHPRGAHLDRAFFSPVLGRSMPYRVFLPPATTPCGRRRALYPVVYLLHGMGGRFDEWSGYGVEEVANQLLADGDLAEAIFVLPRGTGLVEPGRPGRDAVGRVRRAGPGAPRGRHLPHRRPA